MKNFYDTIRIFTTPSVMVPRLKDLIDIHVHILPGLDDGPKDLQESIELASCYERVGVRTVVATPHYLPSTAWAPSKEKIRESVVELQSVLDTKKINLKILPGMEIAYHRKMKERLGAGEMLSLANSGHYLVEPSFHGPQDGLVRDLAHLLEMGQKLILGHPERIDDFQQNPKLLKDLSAKGLYLQVNSGSLLGYFGKSSQKLAQKLQAWNCLDIIASDAHNTGRRPPLTNEEWDSLLSLSGGEKLLQSCITNVARLFPAHEHT
jgi:protein-tyrosine phosphatase